MPEHRYPWTGAGWRSLSGAALALLALQQPAASSASAPGPSAPDKLGIPEAPHQAARPVRIACAGTSITFGYGVVNREQNSYPAQLQAMLGDGYDVRNFGHSGATALASSDIPFVGQPEYREALRFLPDIVFLELGTNDSKPAFRGRTADMEHDYLEIIRSFQRLASRPRVIALLPPPCFLADTTGIAGPVVTGRIIPALQSAAYQAGCELIGLYSLFVDAPVYFPDSIHPSSIGAGVIAQRAYEAVASAGLPGFDLPSRAGIDGAKSSYFGFECVDFTFEGRDAKVVSPRRAAGGAPWLWRARFWGHEPQTEIALLERGYHLVYCDVAELFMNDEAADIWDRFYRKLVGGGLSEKAALEGFSRGGVYIYRWAARHPERVACVYADAPVLDLKSWPGGKGKGAGNPEEWQRFKDDFGLKSEAEALAFRGNPLDLVPAIARAGYLMLHVCGEADETVPIGENTDLFEKAVLQQGGDIAVIRKPGIGHHPHSLPNPQPIVDFILRATGHKVNFAVIPAPGNEYRELAGFRNGVEWHGQFEEMNRMGEKLPRVDVIFLGNSITQGIGGEGRSLVSPPGDSAFRKSFKGISWVNFGIAGDRTQHLLWRVLHGNWPRMNPRLIVLTAGVNNFPGDAAGEVVQGLHAVVQSIVKMDPRTRILLVGPLPAKEKGHDWRKKFEAVHAAISTWNDGKHVFYTPLAFGLLRDDGSLNPAFFGSDGVHLLPQGYERWAELLSTEIQKRLD